MAQLVNFSVPITAGVRFTSASVVVPLGIQQCQAVINGSGWPAAAVVTLGVDLAQDGLTFKRHATIQTRLSSLLAGSCSVGFVLPGPNANNLLRVRAICDAAGANITLIGTLNTDVRVI